MERVPELAAVIIGPEVKGAGHHLSTPDTWFGPAGDDEWTLTDSMSTIVCTSDLPTLDVTVVVCAR